MKKSYLKLVSLLCVAAISTQLTGCLPKKTTKSDKIYSDAKVESYFGAQNAKSDIASTASNKTGSDSSAASDSSVSSESSQINGEVYADVLANFKKVAQSATIGNLGTKIQDGEYPSPNPNKEYEWSSMLADLVGWNFSGLDKTGASFGYTFNDLNGDGTDELIFLLKDYFVLAIYSAADSKPQLLDAYWSRYYATILGNGHIFTYGSSGARTFEKKVQSVESGKNKLALIEKFGVDEGEYYKYEKGNTVQIQESDYNTIVANYPDSLSGFKKSTLKSGIGFIPLFTD